MKYQCIAVSQVKHVMKKEINPIDYDTTVREAAKVMGVSSYVIVLKKGKPVGIVTERDIINKVLAIERDPAIVKVSEIMSSPLRTIDPDDDLIKASQLMRELNIGKLVVMKDDILYGVITDLTITRYFQEYVDRSVRDVIRWTASLGI